MPTKDFMEFLAYMIAIYGKTATIKQIMEGNFELCKKEKE